MLYSQIQRFPCSEVTIANTTSQNSLFLCYNSPQQLVRLDSKISVHFLAERLW